MVRQPTCPVPNTQEPQVGATHVLIMMTLFCLTTFETPVVQLGLTRLTTAGLARLTLAMYSFF